MATTTSKSKPASQVLAAKRKKVVDLVEIVRHDGPLMVPEGLTLSRLDEVLHRQMEYEEQRIAVQGVIDGCFFYDGAYALHQVLMAKFGLAQSINTTFETMFGTREEPPQMITVATGPTTSVEVPFGRFALPNIDGHLESSYAWKDGRFLFSIGGEVKRKHEEAVQEIVAGVKEYVKNNSIYRGKAFSVKWHDENGHQLPLPEPRFLRIEPGLRQQLIFSEGTRNSIETNVFTPIERTMEAVDLNMSLKRGVLLHGQFGTGKSMTSAVTAALAVQHGWTFIAVETAQELAENLSLGRMYEPAVIFCEDIDRTMSGDERTVEMDEILNLIDGIESKNAKLMVVLTTNAIEKINKALLRPGRLDAVIEIPAPDAVAAEALLRMYGGKLIKQDEDIAAAAGQVAGAIPAVLRELVDRSKWAGLKLTKPGEDFYITGEALLEVSKEMTQQMELLKIAQPDTRSDREKAAGVLADSIREAGGVKNGKPAKAAASSEVAV